MSRTGSRTAAGIVATIALLGAGCSAPAPKPADEGIRAYVKTALEFMSENGLYVDETWDAQVQHTLQQTAGALTLEDTYGPLALAARAAGGVHSQFLRPDETLEPNEPSTIVPLVQSLSSQVSSILLPEFNSADPSEMKEYGESAIARIEDLTAPSCGWVIDLRNNRGGNVYPMLLASAPFLPEGTPVLSFVDRQNGRSQVTLDAGGVDVDGSTIVRADGLVPHFTETRIAILQNRATASAAEAVLIAFEGQANSRTFGEATAGYPTGNVAKTLADGAILVVTRSREVDRTGRSYDGPIQPDVRIGDGPAQLDAAIAWLDEGC